MNRSLWTAVGVTLLLLGGASVAPTVNWSIMRHALDRIGASGGSLWDAFNSVPLEARLLPGLGLLLIMLSALWIKHLHRSPRRIVLDLARRQLPTSAIARHTHMSQDAVRSVLFGDVAYGKRLRFNRRDRKVLPLRLHLPAPRLLVPRGRLTVSGLH